MFFLLSFLSDTLDFLEEFLEILRRTKEEDTSISKKKKLPKPTSFMDLGF